MPYQKPTPPPPIEFPVPTLTGYGHPAMPDNRLVQGVCSGKVGVSGGDGRKEMMKRLGTLRPTLGQAPSGSLFNPAAYGLVSWWLNDASASITADSYGTNTLTNNNGVTATSGVSSSTGSAGSFTAASSMSLTCASNSTLQVTGDFWIHYWANITFSGFQTAVCKWGGGGTAQETEYKASLRANTPNYAQFDIGNNTTSDSIDTFNNVVLNAGFNAVLVWHNSTAQTINVQVNNGTVYSKAWTGGTYSSGSGTFAIGRNGSFASHFIDGSVGPVAFGKNPPGGIGSVIGTLGTLLYNGGLGRKFPF